MGGAPKARQTQRQEEQKDGGQRAEVKECKGVLGKEEDGRTGQIGQEAGQAQGQQRHKERGKEDRGKDEDKTGAQASSHDAGNAEEAGGQTGGQQSSAPAENPLDMSDRRSSEDEEELDYEAGEEALDQGSEGEDTVLVEDEDNEMQDVQLRDLRGEAGVASEDDPPSQAPPGYI